MPLQKAIQEAANLHVACKRVVFEETPRQTTNLVECDSRKQPVYSVLLKAETGVLGFRAPGF